jgi:plasmid stability protein
MGQILVRNLDETALKRLRLRADERHIPLERLIRDAIHDLARPTQDELLAEADRLRKAIGSVSGDSTELIRRDRDSR